jgi:hypothetical protein
MSSTRRHSRIPYSGPVRITWQDERGETKFAFAKCLDVSESGLRIEVPITVRLGTYVTLHAERINVRGTASVRNISRSGQKFILGLELSAKLRDTALEQFTEPVKDDAPLPAAAE